MGIYFICILLVCVYGILFFYKSKEKKNKIGFIIMSFLTMFIIMAIRDITVGTDTELYCVLFEQYGNIQTIAGAFQESAPIYVLYNMLVYNIFHIEQYIIVFNSLIIMVLTAKFIYDNSKNVVISTLLFILLYHYIQSFNIARQYISIMIIAYASKYLIQNKTWKFLLATLIATLIHNTSIVCLLMIPLKKIKITKKNIFFILVASIGVLLTIPYVIQIFIKIFPHYQMYFSNENSFLNAGEGRKIILTLFYAAMLFYDLFIRKKTDNKAIEEKRQLLDNLIFIAVICGILSIYSILIGRLELYYSIYIILLIPEIIEEMKKGRHLMYYLTLLILFIPFYIQLTGNQGGILPYQVFG